MLPYKEQGSNLDKRLSSYLNIILQSPIKYPMKYPIYLQDQDGGPSVKLPLISRFVIMAFNFGYVYNMFTWFKQNIYIKNSSSHNLTDSFTIHEIDDCQCVIPKEINIFIFLTSGQYPNWDEKNAFIISLSLFLFR